MFSTLFASNRPYVKAGYEEKISQHKYSCQNDSIYYAFVQNPLCDWIVSKLPWTLAPNLITITGELCVVFAVLLMCGLYGWDLNGGVPSWLIFLTAFLYWMNNTLDNTDGKQARRTGSGSPMGMLFDHGCDAMTAVMSSLIMAKCFSLGNGFFGLWTFFLPTISFYFFTLQEYYLGYMLLPAITGPDDMQLAFMLMIALAGYTGCEFWQNYTWDFPYFGLGKVQVSALLVLFFIFLEIPQVILEFHTNLTACSRNEHFKSRFQQSNFIRQVLFMPILCGVWLLYVLTTPGSHTMINLFPLVYSAYGAQFLVSTHRLMICDASSQQFQPFRRTQLISWMLLGLNAFCLHHSSGKSGFMNEKHLLILVNVLSWGAVCHQIYYTLDEFTTILDINIFTIKYPEKLKKPDEDKTHKQE